LEGHYVRRPHVNPLRKKPPVSLVETCPVVLEVPRGLAEPLEELQENEPLLLGRMLEMIVLRREVFQVLATSAVVAARAGAA
jgi:hypothetical protein